MKLKDYDGKLIRITDPDGAVFEGICEYNSAEYNEVMYGEEEESLMLACYNFYAGTIEDVQVIEAFSGPYGHLEEDAIETDAMLVDEFFECENDEYYSYRMMAALEHYLTTEDKARIPDLNALADVLKEVIALTEYDDLRARAQKLIPLCA